MTQEKLEQLKATATEVRRGILTEVHAAKSGHPGGSLSGRGYYYLPVQRGAAG